MHNSKEAIYLVVLEIKLYEYFNVVKTNRVAMHTLVPKKRVNCYPFRLLEEIARFKFYHSDKKKKLKEIKMQKYTFRKKAHSFNVIMLFNEDQKIEDSSSIVYFQIIVIRTRIYI